MKIAFIHYHLKPGGVTTVLKSQLEAVRRFGEAIIISGEPPEENWPVNVFTVPGIAYSEIQLEERSPSETSQSILNIIHSHWPDGCDLIHIHNPTLAKNKLFLKIIKEIQKSEIPLFLQIHDFAEDGRPHSFFNEPYPDNCHYGVLNKRDYDLLLKSGIRTDGLHLIPNSVSISENDEKSKTLTDCVLYPVRAIRRKNIGEAILLSLFFKDKLPLRITLPPNSAADQKSYDFWQKFSLTHNLNIEFEVGLKFSFSDLIDSARWVLTTSIVEGFGFSFVESWLYGKPVWGRYLSGICSAFENVGIRFSQFYSTIDIPLDWIDETKFLNHRANTLKKVYQLYNLPVDDSEIIRAGREISRLGKVDFGMLDEQMQRQVLNKIIENKTYFEALLASNPFLNKVGSTQSSAELIDGNARLIKKEFGLDNSVKTLKNSYLKVLQFKVKQEINKEKLLKEFLNPYSFSLLKWGDFAE